MYKEGLGGGRRMGGGDMNVRCEGRVYKVKKRPGFANTRAAALCLSHQHSTTIVCVVFFSVCVCVCEMYVCLFAC